MWGPEFLLSEQLMNLRVEELKHSAATRRLLLETAMELKEQKPRPGRGWLFRLGRFLVVVGRRLEEYALIQHREEPRLDQNGQTV